MKDDDEREYQKRADEYYDRKTRHREEMLPTIGMAVIIVLIMWGVWNVYHVFNLWLES